MDAEAGPSGGGGAAAGAAALDWRFGQVFGERTPGDEVQEGARRSLRTPALIGPAASWPRAAASRVLVRTGAATRTRRAAGACALAAACRNAAWRACGLFCGAETWMLPARPGATLCAVARWADASAPPAPAADIISAVEFDATGAQLATGDRGGRVVLFEQVEARAEQARGATTRRRRMPCPRARRGGAGRGGRGCSSFPGTCFCCTAAARAGRLRRALCDARAGHHTLPALARGGQPPWRLRRFGARARARSATHCAIAPAQHTAPSLRAPRLLGRCCYGRVGRAGLASGHPRDFGAWHVADLRLLRRSGGERRRH